MNWSDFIVLGIILVFAFIGMSSGFVLTIFRVAAYFAGIIVSIKFYPVLSNILMKTAIYENIKNVIAENLLIRVTAMTPAIDGQVKQTTASAVVDNLGLPGFLKGPLATGLPDLTKLVDVNQITDMLSSRLAGLVIDVISLIVVYILVRIGLAFAEVILKGITKLPVFKQIDKLGGFSIGAVEGLLTVYIIFTLLLLFASSPSFVKIFEAIESSKVAKFFYDNNFIVNWMFPGLLSSKTI